MLQELCNVFLFIGSVLIDWIASLFSTHSQITSLVNWDDEVILITGGNTFYPFVS